MGGMGGRGEMMRSIGENSEKGLAKAGVFWSRAGLEKEWERARCVGLERDGSTLIRVEPLSGV